MPNMVLKTKKKLYYTMRVTVALIALIAFGLPIMWVIWSSFKNLVDVIALPPKVIVPYQIDNYTRLLFRNHFDRYVLNTIVVAVTATAVALLLGYPAAYFLGRYRFRGNNALNYFVLSLFMAPPIIVALPFSVFFSRFRLLDTFAGMLTAHVTITLPLAIWLLQGFVSEVDVSIEEAAALDGATITQRMYAIVLPNIRSGFAATALLCFLFSWNDFLYGLILGPFRMKLLPAATIGLVSYAHIEWNVICAAATIIVTPALIVTFGLHNELVKGFRQFLR
jgi:multiple sugar transport system permease protein